MKRLFEYDNYQIFLNDFYNDKKRDNPYVLWYLGYHTKLDPSFLKCVLEGKEHLHDFSINAVCTYFKFSKLESGYFRFLVRSNKRGNTAERQSTNEEPIFKKYKRFIKRPALINTIF